MELSQILEWQKYLLFAHKIVYSMEWSWSEVLEWSGVRFRMECSCDVCVCGQVLCHRQVVFSFYQDANSLLLPRIDIKSFSQKENKKRLDCVPVFFLYKTRLNVVCFRY